MAEGHCCSRLELGRCLASCLMFSTVAVSGVWTIMLFRLWQRARRGSILEYGAHLVVDGPKARIVTAVEHDHEAVGGMLDKHQKAVPRPPRDLVADKG